jgi:hypothetical protein
LTNPERTLLKHNQGCIESRDVLSGAVERLGLLGQLVDVANDLLSRRLCRGGRGEEGDSPGENGMNGNHLGRMKVLETRLK